MPISNKEFALQAARNATVIMRELPDIDPFEHHLASIDFASSVGVRMAFAEYTAPNFWDARSWEEVCAAVAKWLVKHKKEMPDAVLAKLLGVSSRALR